MWVAAAKIRAPGIETRVPDMCRSSLLEDTGTLESYGLSLNMVPAEKKRGGGEKERKGKIREEKEKKETN